MRFHKKESLVLYISMFIMGACGLAYEYTLSKLSTDLLGNSIQQWALTIGIMMFFMGVGSDIQKYFRNKSLFHVFIYGEIALALAGGFAPVAILFAFSYLPNYFVFVQYFFIAAIGLLIGFEIPILTRINASYSKQVRFNLGNILKMDYFGALVGALAWVYGLSLFLSIIEMSFFLGTLSALSAAIAIFVFRKAIPRKRGLVVACTAATILLVVGYSNAAKWTTHAEQALFRDRIVAKVTSPFQHIVLTKSPELGISMYINGHLQFNEEDEHIYHENLVHPPASLVPNLRKALVLGGGDGLAVRELLKYPSIEEVVLADLDPAVTELARTQPDLVRMNEGSLLGSKITQIKNKHFLPSPTVPVLKAARDRPHKPTEIPGTKVRIMHVDAFNYLNEAKGKYDLIIADFPDPNSPELSKLYSKTFYQMVRSMLNPTGIFVQQSSSPYYAKESFLCIGRTMEAAGLVAIPYHDNVPSFGEWGFWIGTQQGPASATKNALRNTKLTVPTDYLTDELISSSLVFPKGGLEADSKAINTITTNPITALYQKGWNRF